MDSETKTIIKKIHDLLYSNGLSGEKAMNDIIRIIFLKINQEYLIDLSERIKDNIKYKEWLQAEDFDKDTYKYLNWEHLYKATKEYKEAKKLTSTDRSQTTTLMHVCKMLTFDKTTSKFFRSDNCINLTDRLTLVKIMELINELDSDKFKESDVNGSIYEYMINSYLNNGKLGQFFTPRKIVNMLIDEIKLFPHLKELETIKIYDPCMGTAGFLQRLGAYFKNQHVKIYGSEIEPDTIMYGMMNLMLYNDIADISVECENSLFVEHEEKYDVILTNPPYGIKFDKNECLRENCLTYNKTSRTKALISNKGEALFILKCASLLSEGGVCGIVLPYGSLFVSKTTVFWRQYMMKNYNIRTIIVNGKGVFEHTDIDTANIIFSNDGPTEEIEFVIGDNSIIVDIDELNKVQTWNYKNYETIENLNTTINYKTIGELCKFEKKSKRKASFANDSGAYKFFTSSFVERKCDEYDYDGEYIVLGTGGTANINYINGKFSCSTDCLILTADKYIYYYLMVNINLISDLFKGLGIKHVSKEDITNIRIPQLDDDAKNTFVDKCELIYKNINMCKELISNGNSLIGTKFNGELGKYTKLEEKTIGELCEFEIKSKRKASFGQQTGKYPFFKSSFNITCCDEYDYDGEYVILGTGGNASINYVNGKFSCSTDCLIIKSNKYMYYYLLSNIDILSNLFNGLGIKHISKEDVKNIKIPTLSPGDQTKLIHSVDKVYDLIRSKKNEIGVFLEMLDAFKA